MASLQFYPKEMHNKLKNNLKKIYITLKKFRYELNYAKVFGSTFQYLSFLKGQLRPDHIYCLIGV